MVRRVPRLRHLGMLVVASLGGLAGESAGQPAPLPSVTVPYLLESGFHDNPGDRPVTVWQGLIVLPPEVPWLRVFFAAATLGPESRIRVTSLLDHDSQSLGARHLLEWRHSTAFFNGPALKVELVSGPGARGDALRIVEVLAGQLPRVPVATDICGDNDDRVTAFDPRVGRLLRGTRNRPASFDPDSACTGFLIDTPATGNANDRVHLAAGHCFVAGNQPNQSCDVLQFNVCLSKSDCTLRHPAARKQFAVRPPAANTEARNGGEGLDWAAFRCFPNPDTCLTTFQEQRAAFRLATEVPALGTAVWSLGYGVDGNELGAGMNPHPCPCVPNADTGRYTQILQKGAGRIVALDVGRPATAVGHDTDTCAGSSGSPVVALVNNQERVIGIHTHANCEPAPPPFFNTATTATSQALLDGITAAAGVAVAACAAIPAYRLTTGDGPGGVTVTVDGWGMFGSCPTAGTTTDLIWRNPVDDRQYRAACWSAVLLEDPANCPAPGRHWLASNPGNYPVTIPFQAANPAVTVVTPGRHIQTQQPQMVCGYRIEVEQRVSGPDPQESCAPWDGSTLTQVYRITNTGNAARTFTLVRFLDADLGAEPPLPNYFLNDRMGASRRLADCGAAAPPYQSNREWVFEYDPAEMPHTAIAMSVEGLDATQRPVAPLAFEGYTSAMGHPVANFLGNPVGFLTGALRGDTDGNLLLDEGTGGDAALVQGMTFANVAPGATVTAFFRTRVTTLDREAPGTSVETRARDVTCAALRGNYSGAAGGALLCVNGQTECARVQPLQVVNVNLAAPAGGPGLTPYILYLFLGHPSGGVFCGSPIATDASLWGLPGGFEWWGLGSFPVRGVFGSWTGGGGGTGIGFLSPLPGLALLTGSFGSGAIPCGNQVFTLPVPLLPDLALTLQAAVFDFGARRPSVPFSLSNAVTLTIGNCPCPVH